jgi:Icc-related predicted phosphoesterase
LLLAGLGGSIRYNTEPGPQYTEFEMTRRFWMLTPRLFFNRLRYGRYLDVMLTHAPPLHIHNGDDYPHRGFKIFLLLMDYFAPRYLIHGHMHRSYNIRQATATRYLRTTIINTAGYRLLTIGNPTQGGSQ